MNDICDKCKQNYSFYSDESGDYCTICYQFEWVKSALEAGIPRSVIEGRTKLTDHFSQEYIDSQCGKTKENDDE